MDSQINQRLRGPFLAENDQSGPVGLPTYRAALEYAKRLRRTGECHLAEDVFRNLCRLFPSEVEPVVERARLRWSMGDVEGAEDLLRQAISMRPDRALPSVLLARLLVQKDAVSEASAVIERSVALYPFDPLLLLAQGEVLLTRGEFLKAQEAFEKAKEHGASPGAAKAGLSRVALAEGNLALHQGHLQHAVFLFKKAFDLNPRFGEPLAQLALTLSELGNHRKAALLVRQAMNLSPSCSNVHYRAGLIFGRRGEQEGAAAAFAQALKIDPMHLQAKRALADLLFEQDPGKALLLYAEEVARHPSDGTLWQRLGELCLRLGDKKQAERCFAEAQRLGVLQLAEEGWNQEGKRVSYQS